MAHVTEPAAASTRHSRQPLFYIGAGALLFAMLIETIAVLGRQLGKPLLGTVELMQTAILLAATSAMLCTTLSETHARVTLLTDRVSPMWQRVLQAISLVLSVSFFVALAAGALWLAVDFWNAHEESELLHIPYKPLRILSVAAAFAIAVVLVWNFVRRRAGTER